MYNFTLASARYGILAAPFYVTEVRPSQKQVVVGVARTWRYARCASGTSTGS